MEKRISENSIYIYITLLLILAAVAIRGGASYRHLQAPEVPFFNLSDIHHAFPLAVGSRLNGDGIRWVEDGEKNHLGYALVSEDLDAHHQGYAGNTPLWIACNTEKVIIGVFLLPNKETREFIDHINDKHLLESWNGMPLDSLVLNHNVDAVSGATKSSVAIIYTFEKTVNNYLDLVKLRHTLSWYSYLQFALWALLLFLSLSMVLKRKYKKYYFYYLTLVFIVLGLGLKKMLSIDLLYSWLSTGLPWQSNWELILVLIIAIGMAIMGHKSYYCNYMCPMGAMQMLVNKLSPFKKRRLNLRISVLTLRLIYLCFIGGALLLGFLLPLAQMEPFMAFSFSVATKGMLGAGAGVLFLSLFFTRPWCQLCPTGCLLNSIPSLKTKNIRYDAK